MSKSKLEKLLNESKDLVATMGEKYNEKANGSKNEEKADEYSEKAEICDSISDYLIDALSELDTLEE
jgi:hypothetical protein